MKTIVMTIGCLGAIALTACGGGGGGGPTIVDAPPSVDSPPGAGQCNPATQTGCGPSEICGVSVNDAGNEFTTECLPAPASPVAKWASGCSWTVPGTSNCEGGSMCGFQNPIFQLGGAPDNYCHDICNGDTFECEGTPPGTFGQACVQYSNLLHEPEGPSTGFCELGCDEVAGGDADGCDTAGNVDCIVAYGNPSGYCRPKDGDTTPVGSACPQNDCGLGGDCIAPDLSGVTQDFVCQKTCSVAGGGAGNAGCIGVPANGNGTGTTCYQFKAYAAGFFSDAADPVVQNLDSDMGICIDCNVQLELDDGSMIGLCDYLDMVNGGTAAPVNLDMAPVEIPDNVRYPSYR